MQSELVGLWRIEAMETWDRDSIELLGPAFIEINSRGRGVLQFLAIEGSLDCRFGKRDDESIVEFSWVGFDESDPASGRGWLRRAGDESLQGHIFIHDGDDSVFRAVRYQP